MPKKKLREALVTKGLTSKTGKPISDSTLYNMFRNKKYIGIYEFGEGEVVGGCDPIVDVDIFEKVQNIIESKAHGKSGDKAKEEYLLSGKLFCGLCGRKLNGNSSYNKKDVQYSYYQCMGRKFEKICEKKSEKKDFLEWYVVEQTCEYVLRPDRIDYIAARIVARYDDEFNDKEIKAFERQLAKVERDINAAVENSLEVPKEARHVYFDKITTLTAQKSEIEHELTVLRIATRHRWNEEQIITWLKKFTVGDELDKDFQRRIINMFINSVFVYDDKIIIYYNVKDSKQVSHIDMLDTLEECIEDVPLNVAENTGVGGGDSCLDNEHSPFLKRFQNSTVYECVKYGQLFFLTFFVVRCYVRVNPHR